MTFKLTADLASSPWKRLNPDSGDFPHSLYVYVAYYIVLYTESYTLALHTICWFQSTLALEKSNFFNCFFQGVFKLLSMSWKSHISNNPFLKGQGFTQLEKYTLESKLKIVSTHSYL